MREDDEHDYDHYNDTDDYYDDYDDDPGHAFLSLVNFLLSFILSAM